MASHSLTTSQEILCQGTGRPQAAWQLRTPAAVGKEAFISLRPVVISWLGFARQRGCAYVGTLLTLTCTLCTWDYVQLKWGYRQQTL